MAVDAAAWSEANQQFLSSGLAEVRAALERRIARAGAGLTPVDAPAAAAVTAWRWEDPTQAPPALDRLCENFGLSTFERQVILLCAGIELDGGFAALCAAAQGDPARPFPTFGLALAALAEPHWSALSPNAPLRRWRMVELVDHGGVSLTGSRLRIDERVLHFLAGVYHLDERLVGLVQPAPPDAGLVPSHRVLAHRIAVAWSGEERPLPLIQLCGADEASKRAIAVAGCAAAGLHLFLLPADLIPTPAEELETLLRLWEREAALTASALYVETDAVEPGDGRAALTVSRLLERVGSAALLSTRDRWRPLQRSIVTVDVRKPLAVEQRGLWQAALGHGNAGLNGHLDELVAQFNLSAPAIAASAREAVVAGVRGDALADSLWESSRAQARPRLDDLAQRIEPVATWDDLVVPENEERLLRGLAAHVRHRATVYESWGLGGRSSRGLGISALFAGGSGTGKTLAAEVLANALRLDLYRIDLAGVVSKYIGETEKNLRRVFDAAEDGGAILFFDEADALFGKRSEVKDSHDRYANIEINYLLQRMEAYRGVAVLATNMKSALDPAFLRRIRFVVTFHFPDVVQRAAIWRRMLPDSSRTEDLDVDKLARLSVAGGNIRNIALNAAFLAVEAGDKLRMEHLLRAARIEFAKMEKPLAEAEIRGWV